jgi:hypothetical protein
LSEYIEPTPEEIEAARAMVAEADRRKAAEEQALREAYMEPVRSLVSSAAWTEVLEGLQSIADQYEGTADLSVHVNALAEIMPRLETIAGVAAPVPALAPAQVEGATNGE